MYQKKLKKKDSLQLKSHNFLTKKKVNNPILFKHIVFMLIKNNSCLKNANC